MSRFALLVWVLSPLVVIGALWQLMDRSRGTPNLRERAIAAARLPGQAADSPRDAATLAKEQAETEARKAAQAVAKGGAQPPAGGGAEPQLVQPESLPQGFILLVVDRSQRADNDSPIYLASSHNGWNPSDPERKLTRQSDMRWRIILPKPSLDSKMAFKFTRGSWDLVETKDNFEDIDNRLLPMVDMSKVPAGEKPVIELVIDAWKDGKPSGGPRSATDPYGPIKVAAGTIRRVEVVGGGGVSSARDVLVWLPPGYDDAANAKRTYPVLYMQDGQNLFEKVGGIPAEWGADETAAKLIEEKRIEPLIIVGIPHSGAGRMAEYTPLPLFDNVPADGKAYVDFLVNRVKPRIDALFRTAPGAENTGVGGASLGGMIALEAGTERPDVFGKVLAESAPMLEKNRAAFLYFAKKKTWPKMVYFGMGGKEKGLEAGDDAINGQYAASASAFGEALKGRGFTAQTLRINLDPGAVHNEEAWAKRFPDALTFLFPPVASQPAQ